MTIKQIQLQKKLTVIRVKILVNDSRFWSCDLSLNQWRINYKSFINQMQYLNEKYNS